MTGTGRSNNDVIAEAVAAIGPYKAWIAARRGEIQAQIAQMQAAAAPTTPTSDPSLASRFKHLGLPQRNGGTGSAPLPTASEGTVGVDATVTATADTESTHATAPEDVAETARVAEGSRPEEPVSVPSAPAPPTALPTPQHAKEAQAQLETVFAATPPQTLPPVLVEAWGQRGRDAMQCTKLLVAAQDAGLLPDTLAHAVTTMIALDGTFRAVANAYRLGMYRDLVGIFPPTVQRLDEQEADEDEADDAEEGEGDETEEEQRQPGFPGGAKHERPF